MKRLYKLEQSLGRYGERLLRERAPPQNQWIVNEIRTILDDRMAAHSSKPELKQHFTELFSGLETITAPAGWRGGHALAPEHSEAQILARFDEVYYHGQATFEFAARVLADARVQNVDHFVRAVAQGGTILRAWSGAQRELFQLHAANKLWRLGRRDAARAKLRADYSGFWRERLQARSPGLPGATLRPLARALAATGAVPVGELAGDVCGNWRSLYAVWVQCVVARVAVGDVAIDPVAGADRDGSDAHLWRALQHLAARHGDGKLPAELDIVPSTAADAPRQIRSALLRRAQTERDAELVDLVLASSAHDDKIAEAGALAAKLALA